MNYIYSNLKYIRESKGMSMNKFAYWLGYSTSTIYRWENQCNGITINSAAEISKKMKIPLDILITKDLSKSGIKILDFCKNSVEEEISAEEFAEIVKDLVNHTTNLNDKDKEKIKSDMDYFSSKN